MNNTIDYKYSLVSGGGNGNNFFLPRSEGNYPFFIENGKAISAPPELLEPNILNIKEFGIDKQNALIFYFENLYPLTKNTNKWKNMSYDKLQDYYDNLQFWYIFNNSITSCPMPITLSDTIYKKWLKCTFYQANTIVQTSITSWGLAYRKNNGPQENSVTSVTYKNSKNKLITINSVCKDKEYWDTICDNIMEVTSWGWNPYPMGVYFQGPFNGSGNFLYIPKQSTAGTIIGTCHWDIIFKMKPDNVTSQLCWEQIWLWESKQLIWNSTASSSQASKRTNVYYTNTYPYGYDVTPLVIIRLKNNQKFNDNSIIKIDTLNGKNVAGSPVNNFPLLLSYFCYIVGGFGGIGGTTPYDNTWKNNQYYIPVFDVIENNVLVFSLDQTITFPDGKIRQATTFWNIFTKFFNLLQRWDVNWGKESWRYPPITGPSAVINVCDDLMMAACTGNFNICKYSLFLLAAPNNNPTAMPVDAGNPYAVNPKISKFYTNPIQWSHYQTLNGVVNESKKGNEGFPIGKIVNLQNEQGHIFVIRTQMPNVNGDLCSEFADFRVLTPGSLSNGSGNQQIWKELLTYHSENYMYTADPDNHNIKRNFKDEYAVEFPDTTIKTPPNNKGNWTNYSNEAVNNLFVKFNINSGIYQTNPYLMNVNENGITSPINNYAGAILPGTPDYVTGPQVFNKTYWNCTKKDRKNTPDKCNPKCNPNSLTPPIVGNSLIKLSGGGIISSEIDACRAITTPGITLSWMSQMASTNTSYFPSEVDNFSNGVIGSLNYDNNPFNSNGIAIMGACQTKWCMATKAIPWKFNAPLSNRLLLIKGVKIMNPSKSLNIKTKLPDSIINSEIHKLRTYFALVYPAVNVNRWNNMSLNELQIFFCSLHWWYKGDGLPSPKDYINTDLWNNTVPFGGKSSWKPFCLRKNCVIGVSPSCKNENDNKLCVGYNKDFSNPLNKTETETTQDESPSMIIWNGRQLLGLAAASQQTTFFNPSQNYHIDTYNSFPTVNDTDINAWEKSRFVEVSSQWGPFPDGVYYDWAPGTGVWLDLGNHKVGYNGLDLVRRLGLEFKNKNLDLTHIYQEAWNKTGLFTANVNNEGKVNLPIIDVSNTIGILGLYGSVILTNQQQFDLYNLTRYKGADGKYHQKFNLILYDSADGVLFKNIAFYVKPQYYIKENGKWVWSDKLPISESYIENYPLPLPYYTKHMGDGNNNVKINPLALEIPWEYQLFNIANMARRFTIDLLFLDSDIVDITKPTGLEYVDWLKANQLNPLKTPNTWKQALDKLNELLSKPINHPVFLRYPRVSDNINSNLDDGPYLVLMNAKRLIYKGLKAPGSGLTLLEIQTAALNKDIFIQSVYVAGGVKYTDAGKLVQSASANLEIDHWLPMLGHKLNYDSCVRIQHWCGNKSLSLDIEIINISQKIDGSLISNIPQTNLYETWKKQGENKLYIRDPFQDDSHVYHDDGKISNIRNKYKHDNNDKVKDDENNMVKNSIFIIIYLITILILIFLKEKNKINNTFLYVTISLLVVLAIIYLIIVIRKNNNSKTGENYGITNILWTPPPWISYTPNNIPQYIKNSDNLNLEYTYGTLFNNYGWPCENLDIFWASNRLTYCPCNTSQIALSGSYPEYNKILYEYFLNEPNLLKL